jgi:hypothetical protein
MITFIHNHVCKLVWLTANHDFVFWWPAKVSKYFIEGISGCQQRYVGSGYCSHLWCLRGRRRWWCTRRGYNYYTRGAEYGDSSGYLWPRGATQISKATMLRVLGYLSCLWDHRQLRYHHCVPIWQRAMGKISESTTRKANVNRETASFKCHHWWVLTSRCHSKITSYLLVAGSNWEKS